MRAAVLLLLALALPAGAQTTFHRWQDMGAYVGQQTEKLNQHTDEIAALKAEVDALKAEVVALKTDAGIAAVSYDILLYYLLVQACYANSMAQTWGATLIGLQPFPLGDHDCPEEPAKFYVPSYLSPVGPLIPE